VVCKTKLGTAELINVWHSGDFENAVVDVKVDCGRGVIPTHISMRRRKNILVAITGNELLHSELEMYTVTKGHDAGGFQRSISNMGRETSNFIKMKSHIKRMGTQFVGGIRENIKAESLVENRLKMIS
jgi:hypothetical protein